MDDEVVPGDVFDWLIDMAALPLLVQPCERHPNDHVHVFAIDYVLPPTNDAPIERVLVHIGEYGHAN